MSKRSELLARADLAATKAASEAVTKIMKDVTIGKGLPAEGLDWTLQLRDDFSAYLVGHIESATPDDIVRGIVDKYASACSGPDAAVGTRRHGDDPRFREYEATGLVIDGAPVEVWGILGYSAGESGE